MEAPAPGALPSSTPRASPSASPSARGHVDPLVMQAAAKIAAAINDFKRELDERDGTWADAHGTFELAVSHAQTWELAIVPDDDGDEYPITVSATLKPATNGHVDRAPLSRMSPPPTLKPARSPSDVGPERHLVSRKKRKLDGGDTSNKHQRTVHGSDDQDEQDIMPFVTKDRLNDLLGRLRDDIQEDTSECVNHVQHLLRRFRQEWHDKSSCNYQHAPAQQTRNPFRDSLVSNASQLPSVSFPSPSVERDDQNTSTPDLVRREAKLISTQIKWVEECRRVAADAHDRREETWRTSSAGFHDRQRQDRENFQNRILHESSLHSQTLSQILNEVKAIGLYAQSMKWETPTSHLAYSLPAVPAPPAFPMQPAPIQTALAQARGAGGGGIAPKHATQPNQPGQSG